MPVLPPGFEIENPGVSTGAVPPLPPGFELDAPEHRLSTAKTLAPPRAQVDEGNYVLAFGPKPDLSGENFGFDIPPNALPSKPGEQSRSSADTAAIVGGAIAPIAGAIHGLGQKARIADAAVAREGLAFMDMIDQGGSAMTVDPAYRAFALRYQRSTPEERARMRAEMQGPALQHLPVNLQTPVAPQSAPLQGNPLNMAAQGEEVIAPPPAQPPPPPIATDQNVTSAVRLPGFTTAAPGQATPQGLVLPAPSESALTPGAQPGQVIRQNLPGSAVRPLGGDDLRGPPPNNQPPDEPNAFMRMGEQIEKFGLDNFKVSKENEGVRSDILRGIGSMGGIILGAAPAGAVAGPMGAAAAATTLIAASSYDATYREAIAKGASADIADRAATINAGAQAAIMMAPLGYVFRGLPSPVREGFAKTLVNMGTHGVTFASANSLAKFAENYIVRDTGADPNRPLMEGVGNAAAEGLVIGMVVPGLSALFRKPAIPLNYVRPPEPGGPLGLPTPEGMKPPPSGPEAAPEPSKPSPRTASKPPEPPVEPNRAFRDLQEVMPELFPDAETPRPQEAPPEQLALPAPRQRGRQPSPSSAEAIIPPPPAGFEVDQPAPLGLPAPAAPKARGREPAPPSAEAMVTPAPERPAEKNLATLISPFEPPSNTVTIGGQDYRIAREEPAHPQGEPTYRALDQVGNVVAAGASRAEVEDNLKASVEAKQQIAAAVPQETAAPETKPPEPSVESPPPESTPATYEGPKPRAWEKEDKQRVYFNFGGGRNGYLMPAETGEEGGWSMRFPVANKGGEGVQAGMAQWVASQFGNEKNPTWPEIWEKASGMPASQPEKMAATSAEPPASLPSPPAESLAVQDEGAARIKQAAKLREVAAALRNIAEADESRDRQTNTPKRAREAASATENARSRLQIATTMTNLADAIERGEAPKLAGVNSRLQVEALDHALRQGRYTRQRERGLPYAEEQRLKDEPMAPEDVAQAVVPRVFLHPAWAKDAAAAIERYAARGNSAVIRWLRQTTGDRVSYPGPEHVEQLRDAIAAVKKKAGKVPHELQRVADSIAEMDRFHRMGIKTDQDLREALTEYLDLRGGKKKETALARMERELVGQKPGVDFFPTPKPLAERVIAEADIKPGMRVLEPSAGKGDLADAAKEAGATVDAVELSPTLQAILKEKGHQVVGSNFMDFEAPEGGYDRVVMNPPFSDRLDAAHVQRAYDMLKPGGRLVAITGEGVHFGSDRKATEFRAWLDEHGAVTEKLPEGSFKSAFRPTGVATRIVVIDKPKGPERQAEAPVRQPEQEKRKPDEEPETSGSVKIGEIEMTGYHHGQKDLLLRATAQDGEPAGFVQFSEFQGVPQIQMVEVPEGARRKGIASSLIQKLADEYGGYHNLEWSNQTDDGAALKAFLDKKFEGSKPKPTQDYVMLSPDELRVDPQRFQYKSADEHGVTGALHGIAKWEPALANPITAWQDHDGHLYVVNGHQRTDLAKRAEAAGQQNVQIPTRVFRAEDGYTPEYMRALGAYQNIAEGSGTAVDAAKVLRAAESFPPDMTLPTLPPKQAMVQQGQALAKLSDEAFGVVENGVVPAAYAAAVGERIKEPAEQMAALNVLARAHPANAEQARIMVEDIRNSGFLKGAQTTLFGEEAFAKSLVPERARVLDTAMRNLRRARGIFKAAVEGEDTLTAAGNRLSPEGNAQGKTDNERLLDILQRDATTKGPLSEALSDAAGEVAGGKTVSQGSAKFLAAARQIVAGGTGKGVQSRAGADSQRPTGEEGRVEDNRQAPMFGRRSLSDNAEWQALLRRGKRQEALAKAYADRGKPARFRDAESGNTYLVSKDLNHPPDGWRVTTFMKDGTPWGHWEAKDANEAFLDLMRRDLEHLDPVEGAPSFGRRLPAPPSGGAPLFGEAPREATPKAEPAPKLTDKESLERAGQGALFGRQDAAVQAQAARDQAGRGALTAKGEQKRADEGLFAPKEAEQKPLFGRRSGVTQTPAFRAWFGDSKVVNAEGKPLRVYHGTAGDIHAFDLARIGQTFGIDGEGFFFTNNVGHGDHSSANAFAAHAARTNGGSPNVMPVYVSLQNPLIFDDVKHDGFDGRGALSYLERYIGTDEAIVRAKDGGHDGIMVIDRSMQLGPRREPEYVVIAFKPEQIKSAIGNRGAFDPNDARVAFGRRQMTDASVQARLTRMRDWPGPLVWVEQNGREFGVVTPDFAERSRQQQMARRIFVRSFPTKETAETFARDYADGLRKQMGPSFQRHAAAMQGPNTYPHAYAVQALIDEAARITGNKVRIEAYDPDHHYFTVRHPDGTTQRIYGYAMGRLIRIAVEADPAEFRKNMTHEALHALRNLGVFTPTEWRTLEATARREGWIKKHGIDELYADHTETQQVEEAIAEEFARGDVPKPGTFMARMLDKLRQFFARLRNLLRKGGFQTADDVFERARSGEAGAREAGSGMVEKGPTTVRESVEAAQEWFDSGAAAAGRRGPSLQPAVRVAGKVYPGTSHLDALIAHVPKELQGRAIEDGHNRGYVNDKGQFLNRERAQDYALKHDLYAPDAPNWVHTSRELISESLRKPHPDDSNPDRPAEPILDDNGVARLPGAHAGSPEGVSRVPGQPGSKPPDTEGPEGTDGSEPSGGVTLGTGPAFGRREEQTQTPAFKAFFKDSKAVDGAGKPLVVYHGTRSDFAAFDPTRAGENTMHPTSRLGFWFSADPAVANLFTEALDDSTYPPKIVPRDNAQTMPVYLSIQRPFKMTADMFRELQGRPYGEDFEAEQPDAAKRIRGWFEAQKALLVKQGYDGIHVTGDPKYADRFGGEEYAHDAWVAFEPTQIKSAIGNRGTFDPADPRIAFGRRRRGDTPEDAITEARRRFLAKAEPGRAERATTAAMNKLSAPIRAAMASDGAQKLMSGQDFESLADKARALGRNIGMLVDPIALGSDRAQAAAKDFANTLRRIDYHLKRLDDAIKAAHTPKERALMGKALDEQSVFDQRVREKTDEMRADMMKRVDQMKADSAYDAGDISDYKKDSEAAITRFREGEESKYAATGEGLAQLSNQQRADVDRLSIMAEKAWTMMQKAGIVDGRGLPHYMPRYFVSLSKATGDISKIKSGEGRPPAMDPIGGNLRTAGPGRRHHLTPEETVAAAKAKLGEDAELVTDIRALVSSLQRSQRAVAGRNLVDAIREIGRKAGIETVADGPRPDFFTLDHPALSEWRPTFKTDDDGKIVIRRDEDGKPIFEQRPIYIAREFEGPLRAVLTKPPSALYNAVMQVKSLGVSLIMASPMTHNMVIYGKAFPLMPGKMLTLQLYRDGHMVRTGLTYRQAIKNARKPGSVEPKDNAHTAFMDKMIQAGMVPINGGWLQDVTGIAQEVGGPPGKSIPSKAIGAAVGALAGKDAKFATRNAIDAAGDFWHGTLLWERIADLQAGIAHVFYERLLQDGMTDRGAALVAAHIANRFAGVVPNESTSTMLRRIENIILFSRQFTLGNLGIMRDVKQGLPSDIVALLPQAEGEIGAKAAKKVARKIAIATFIKDFALFYGMNALVQMGLQAIAQYVQDPSDDVFEKLGHVGRAALSGYARRLAAMAERRNEHPLDWIDPRNVLTIPEEMSPLFENEPGKQDRIFVGLDHTGRGIYVRNPFGKVGEEFKNWLTRPITQLKNKLSPMVRPLADIAANSDGFGRAIYDVDAHEGLSNNLGAIGDSIAHYASAQVPAAMLQGGYDYVTGAPNPEMSLSKSALPFFTGITVSQGDPMGPEGGVMRGVAKRTEQEFLKKFPKVKQAMERGDEEEAARLLSELGERPSEIRAHLRNLAAPERRASPKGYYGRQFEEHAKPGERERLEHVNH